MKVLAYYTTDTPYERIKDEWLASIQKFDTISYRLIDIPSQGSWLRNTAIKPQIILEALSEQDDSIFYVDIDSKFHRFPKLFSVLHHFDIGVCYLGEELLSGTIYFKNSTKVIQFVEEWVKEQTEDEFDQRVLQRLVEKNTELKILTMPQEYCMIYDTMWYVPDPVVVHYQASRQFRDDYGKEKPI